MFESVQEPTPEQQRLHTLVQWVRTSPVARAVGALLVSSVVGVGLLTTWAWNAAISDHCEDLVEADLSIDELIAIKRRAERYARDPREDAHLSLSAHELSFMMRNNLDIVSELELTGSTVSIRMAVPEGQVCYNIRFVGQFSVDEGVADVVPEHLVIGDLDVSPVARGRHLHIRSASLEGRHAKSATLLDNTEHFEVRDGAAHIRFDDPWEVF